MTASRHVWTWTEVYVLRGVYADWPTAWIARAMGIDVELVYRKACRLGLKKSGAFQATSASGRILRGGRLSVATQFKPGQVPRNKGVKGWQAGGRSRETQFKPGSRPWKTQPIGTYRLYMGNLERKVNDLPGPNSVRWHAVSRLVWEQAHGPVPQGHVVVFKPGRHSAELALITLDAVECLSRRELLARNSVHNLPKPLAQLVQLRGALNRQIRRKEKEQ